jgi:hypothetical protein
LGGAVSLGCARPAERVARHASPEAVEGAVAGLAEPEVQAQIADIANDPEVRRAAENIAATATDGIIAALSEEERQEELTTMAGRYVSAVSAAAARTMGRELGPELERVITGSVDASIREMASEQNISRLERLSAGLTDSVMRGVLIAMRSGIAPEFAREVLHDVVRPGLIAMLDAEMNHALGVTAYEVSRQAVLGAEAGLAGRHEGQGILQRWLLAGPSAIVAWLVLLALVLGLVWLAVRSRRLKRDNERKQAALVSLATALKATESAPWARELRETLRHQLRDQAGSDYLRELLRTNQDLRMRPNKG